MATVTPVNTDLYAVLGVGATADGDAIARAFRGKAKQLHPDTNDAPDAAARFNELVVAYDVLSNHRTRREYDAGRRGSPRVSPADAGRTGVVAAQPATRWTRRRSWIALVGGVLVALLGIGAAWLTWRLHEDDVRQRAHFDPVTASRVGNGDIAFIAADGRVVQTREPEQHGEGSADGPTVKVRYDPANPSHVVVDASSTGRDITFAIVSLKLLIGGPVFAVLGARHLRRRR